ncbi:MAG: hypothetical protein HYW50_05130 [Candidatus Diapherotrites archaeon]|nr:hypothetical protein [Candidatus Diapherotrites archaeon]
MPHERPERGGGAQKLGAILSKMNADIRALNSSILIITQKMRYLVRNEKILGRNLLVLNKKLKEFEGNMGGGGNGELVSVEERTDHPKFSAAFEDISNQLIELRNRIEEIGETYARAEDVKEIKYIVNTIDPLQFVTRKDVFQLLRHRPEPRAEHLEKRTAKPKKRHKK